MTMADKPTHDGEWVEGGKAGTGVAPLHPWCDVGFVVAHPATTTRTMLATAQTMVQG